MPEPARRRRRSRENTAMSKKHANQDHYKVSGRQEKGTRPSDVAPEKQGLSRSQARIARGEAAPPHPLNEANPGGDSTEERADQERQQER
jgi:hypothetical protein